MALHSDSRRLGSLEGRGRLMTKQPRAQKRYLRDAFECTYCGRDLHDALPFSVTLDHVVPRIEGGGNDCNNLVTACRSCNCGRQDRPLGVEQTRRAWINTSRPINAFRELAKAILRGECGEPPTERDISSEERLSTRPNGCGYPSCGLPWCSWCPAQLQQ